MKRLNASPPLPDKIGWVSLQVIANFNKLKKLSKDVRAIAAALESSEALVVEKKGGKYFRVRRKVISRFLCISQRVKYNHRPVSASHICPSPWP